MGRITVFLNKCDITFGDFEQIKAKRKSKENFPDKSDILVQCINCIFIVNGFPKNASYLLQK